MTHPVRNEEIMDWLRKRAGTNDVAEVTIVEVAKQFGLSQTGAYHRLQRLQADGQIARKGHRQLHLRKNRCDRCRGQLALKIVDFQIEIRTLCITCVYTLLRHIDR
jgi:hypothetical protein